MFEPQAEIGADLQSIGAAHGKSYEAGLKSVLLQETLTGSLALFRAEQDNYAEYAGFDPISGLSYLWNFPDLVDAPAGSQNIYPDHLVGRLGALLAVAGLIERERSGAGCHAEVGQKAHGDFGACETCHAPARFSPSSFDHASTGFPLLGRHATLPCQDCHAGKTTAFPP
jgi:hypothetical protein